MSSRQDLPGSGQYNDCSPTIRRIRAEYRALQKDADSLFRAEPLPDNIFEWHFSFRGPPSSVYEGGIYHGKILLPLEYPFKPPTVIMLSPTGRWEEGKKICLSATGFHPELWQPSWSIKTLLMAIIGFMETPGDGAVGAVDMSDEQRRSIATQSRTWKCSVCGMDHSDASLLPSPPAPAAAAVSTPVKSVDKVEEESVATSTSSEVMFGVVDGIESEGPTSSLLSRRVNAGGEEDDGAEMKQPQEEKREQKSKPIDARMMLQRMREARKAKESSEVKPDAAAAADGDGEKEEEPKTEDGTTEMSEEEKRKREKIKQLLDLLIGICLVIIIGIITQRVVLSMTSTGSNSKS